MTRGADEAAARRPPPGLPGLDPVWSRLVTVPGGAGDAPGTRHTWHVLDTGEPVGAPALGTLLCVHGNPTWSYLWRRLLADPPPGWRVVAVDHLGMGYSQRLAAARTVAERVADLGRLTAAMEIDGPVVTVGHDWGGAISLGWALAHQPQLRGVVLTNTAVALEDDDRGPVLIRLAHADALRDTVCVRTPTFVRATGLLSRPALPGDVRRALALPYASAARRRAVGDFVADIPFTEGHPSTAALDAIAEGVRGLDVPALLLWGPRDPVFGERYLADLRDRLPHASLHRYEGASHLVTEDAPAYATAVTQWVGDLDRPVALPEAPPAGSGRTLWSALAERSADETPAVVTVGGSTVTWAALARRVDNLAAGFADAGLRPGDRVALLVPPSPELTATAYAVWRAGGVVVVADQGLGLAGMRRALRSAAVDAVVGAAAGLAAARAMGLPGVRVAVGAGGPRTRLLGASLTT
ncbi:MAG: alpha/beta fold hydrolase, partial [Lapillicoccus sp.]